MFRANHFLAVLSVVAFGPVCSVSIAQTSIPLPVVKNDTYKIARINAYTEVAGGVNSGYDNDTDGSYEEVYDETVNLSASASYSGADGYATSDMNASAFTDFWGTGIPDVGVWGYGLNYSSVDDNDPYEIMGLVQSDFYLHSEADYTVHANSLYPSAGTAANSATLYCGLVLELDGDYDSNLSVYNTATVEAWIIRTDTYAAVGYVTATPLNANATYYTIGGSLGRATAANPTASPVSASDTRLHGFYDTWNVTDATCVGSGFLMQARCIGSAQMRVGTEPQSHTVYADTAGSDERYYSAVAYLSFGTVVP